jgi:hypothetical protein
MFNVANDAESENEESKVILKEEYKNSNLTTVLTKDEYYNSKNRFFLSQSSSLTASLNENLFSMISNYFLSIKVIVFVAKSVFLYFSFISIISFL